MEFIKSAASITYKIFSQTVYLLSLYYLILSFFGIIKFKENKDYEKVKKFAVLVAAHNEKNVIRDAVNSLNILDYPKEKYDVYVIADNCDDNTAEIARKAGAIVYERREPKLRGKGYALEWMFDKLFKMNKTYDAVVIFDADNLVSGNFLTEMNNKLCEGFKVVQGFLDSKNPKDTWITGCYSISFWSSNRMFQLSRSNLKLSNQLGGTGFAIDTEILKKMGWGATCLTEDLEFTCKLVLNGYNVGWAHDARVYDEKPLTLKQSWNQRKRWMQGFADVYSRYFFKLLRKGFKEFNFKAIDCAIYSIQPVVLILFSLSALIGYASSIGNTYKVLTHLSMYISQFKMQFHLINIALALVVILQYIYTPFLLILDKRLNLKIFIYYLIYPFFALTWLPICIQGIMHKNDKEWNHTKHTRSIDISDIEKAN